MLTRFIYLSICLCILPYAFVNILGRCVQHLWEQDSQKAKKHKEEGLKVVQWRMKIHDRLR